MGAYNSYAGVQLKIGDVQGIEFEIGEDVNIEDGIYLGYEGAVVVFDGKLICKFGVFCSGFL